MKRFIKISIACGVLAACVTTAGAVETMRLSTDGGANWVVVVDNGAGDTTPALGQISYSGTVGNWNVSVASSGLPIQGTAIQPNEDLGTSSSSSTAGSLIVQLSDTGFVGFPNETFISTLIGNAGGTVTYNAYRDTNNVLFGTTETYPGGQAGASPSTTASLLVPQGPFSGGLFSSNGVVAATGVTPYSLTLETVITHTSAAQTTTDGRLRTLAPPPCNCVLAFQGPQSVTNCPDDAFPDVTATEDCGAGAGPVHVPIYLISSSTNGDCPSIVTRVFAATNDCGQGSTFTQTIRVNCKPDCTITPSVTIANVGTTNTASVADAGQGATYVWNISNGSIVSGQGTTTLTWKAGNDTNNPVTIFVTVTAATGCQSGCSTSVKLISPPPPNRFGKGDTATIGFWHNKNGQGIINGAANSPALGNWLATTFPCLYGASAPSGNDLTGKANSVVAALFMTKFGGSAPKTDAQVMAVALASYFTDTTLGGGPGPVKFGFNQSAGGTGAKTFNVGSYGTALGLQNNTSYTILQIMQAANSVKCGNQGASLPNDLFDSINSGGDI